MCGIAGLFDGRGRNSIAPGLIKAMADAIAHRGPDGEGFHVAPGIALAHRRLAIIDLGGGHQPMFTPDGSVAVIFNGEIYNFMALRRELEGLGYHFRTRSDTEVILHAWQAWGVQCVRRFSGMFAFALWDGRTETLLLARDRIGKKPLYYNIRDGRWLAFGSELKALHASGWAPRQISPYAVEDYLSYGYVPDPKTIYRDVHKLPPAHMMCWRRGAAPVITAYWDLDLNTVHDLSRRDAVAELDRRLHKAVADRMVSDVPLGAFLSGGVDSSGVVAHMATLSSQPVKTFTIGFGESSHDERGHARKLAERYRTDHRERELPPDSMSPGSGLLDRISSVYDEPFADMSALPTYRVCGVAREQVTVALSGDGGDEAFGGYDFRYELHALEARYRRLLPGGPARAAIGWLGRRWPRDPRLPRPLRAGTVLENLARAPEAAYYADLCIVKPDDVRALTGDGRPWRPGDSALYEAVTAPYLRCPSANDVQRAQYADLKIYLPNDPLVKVDRTSMANSLEVRCPLLDYRVIEFAFRVPADRKAQPGRSKHLLRSLGRRRLPPALERLPKRGFTAPVAEWMRGPYRDWFRDEVLGAGAATRSLVDRAVLERWIDEDARGVRNRSAALWSVWCLERWARRLT